MSSSMSRLLLLLVVGVTLVAGQSCAPNCTDIEAGIDIPDPKNCHNFYTCMADGEPSDVSFPCPEGEKFDVVKGCTTDDPVECFVCEPSCIFSCPPNDDVAFIGDLTDCSKYYLCGMGGPPMELLCEAPNLFFDGEVCQDDESLCCDGCSVFCTDAFVEMADPANCTNFYFCTEENYYPEVTDLFHCPSEETFNSTAGHCQDNGVCIQPCA